MSVPQLIYRHLMNVKSVPDTFMCLEFREEQQEKFMLAWN